MTLKELTFKNVFPLSDFGKRDETKLEPGWYSFAGEDGMIILEKRGDGSSRHACLSALTPGDADLDYYFREQHHWFE